MSKLNEQFTNLREEKNSIVMMGLDPKNNAEALKCVHLSKIKKGLIGFKPNLSFYQEPGYRDYLSKISRNIGPEMIRLLDLKSPDGASTNTAAFKSFKDQFEYVTIAPAAGCIEDTIDMATNLGLETISMGVMSFPGVLREIEDGYKLFKKRIDRAIESGTSGFVLGATAYVPNSGENFQNEIKKYRNLKSDRPILESEMSDDELFLALDERNQLFKYVVQKMVEFPHLVALVPGFGRQGGNLEFFLESGIDLNRCMINGGSDFLKDGDLTPEKKLVEFNAMLNANRSR